MMGQEWIRNMNVHSLPHGPHQPFYNVLVEDGSCRYAAQGEQINQPVDVIRVHFIYMYMCGISDPFCLLFEQC